MGSFGIMHWVILIAVVLLLFGGRGKISDLMGDVAKGIKSFKAGMSDEDEKPRTLPPENRTDASNKDRTTVG
jgi:sec-independent protein translocase protein TatA